MSLRAVLDTNVLVSAFAFPRGVPGTLLDMLTERQFENVVSNYILDELDRILRRIPQVSVAQRLGALGEVLELSELVEPKEGKWVDADPFDDPIVGTALSGDAHVLVTGDKALLRLSRIESLEIQTPRTFRARLGTDG